VLASCIRGKERKVGKAREREETRERAGPEGGFLFGASIFVLGELTCRLLCHGGVLLQGG